MGVQEARRACAYFLARLESEVERLREIDFPGHHPGPRKWLSFIEGILDTAQQYLGPSSGSASQALSVQDAEELGDYAYRFLSHMAGADATQIPHQIVAPFQRWVEELGISNTIFFRAEHLPNYELWTFDASNFVSRLNKPSKKLIDATNDINWPVQRVTVPAQAMGMLPHFAVVAHELGHAIQERITPNLAPHAQDMADCYARIAARVGRHGRSFGNTEILRATDIVDSWMNELKADAVGYLLVGPAFFFALCGFLELAGRSFGVSESHPPSDFRRELLFARLTDGTPSFTDIFRTQTGLTIDVALNSPHLPPCPNSDDLFNDLLKYDPPISDDPLISSAVCVELIPYFQKIAGPIFDAAQQYLEIECSELIYTPETLDFDLDTHLDLLCNLVPPIEYRDADQVQPASLASILNVGWAALLTRIDQIPETKTGYGDQDAKKMEKLHELLLKAVELSEARLLWRNTHDGSLD